METALIVIAGVLANGWVLAVIANNVRRARTERLQLELQAVVLDRLESSADLTAFLATSAGSRFLDAVLVGRQQALAQVMRALQAALVVGLPGVACLALRGAAPAAASGLLVAGVVCVALALGFLAAAAVSYRLTQRWHLLDAVAAE